MDEARNKILEYLESCNQDKVWSKENKQKEALRKKFISSFPASHIKNLSKEEYAIGNSDKSTFCYQIEFGTESLGKMSGATAKKFGLYYGTLGDDKEKKWRIGAEKFGKNIDSALSLILSELEKLASSKAYLSKDDFENSLISPMLRSKVLYLYNPELYLPIYSKDHLAFFCNEFSLLVEDKSHYSLHTALLSYKSQIKPFSKISNMSFATLLYDIYRPYISKSKDSKSRLVTKAIAKNMELVDLGDVESIGSLELFSGKGKGDYSKKAKDRQEVGLIGEKLVVEYEKTKLPKRLRGKIKHVSLTDDSVGYDIVSFDENGNSVYIEVKTSRGAFKKSRYFISENELNKAKSLPNYYIYFVSKVLSKKAMLYKFKFELSKVDFQPIKYLIKVSNK